MSITTDHDGAPCRRAETVELVRAAATAAIDVQAGPPWFVSLAVPDVFDVLDELVATRARLEAAEAVCEAVDADIQRQHAQYFGVRYLPLTTLEAMDRWRAACNTHRTNTPAADTDEGRADDAE